MSSTSLRSCSVRAIAMAEAVEMATAESEAAVRRAIMRMLRATSPRSCLVTETKDSRNGKRDAAVS